MASLSLASRLLIVMALWLSVALLVTGILLSTLFRKNAESNFQGLLLAHAYNLMGAIDLNKKGKLEGAPNLGDPRFLSPLSGWYWSVSKADSPFKPLLHSASITGEKLNIPTTVEKPFDRLFRRSYDVDGTATKTTHNLEAQLYLGEGDTLYQVLIAGNKSEIEAATRKFDRTLVKFFLLFGLGTICASYFAIRFGLRPLQRAAASLHDIRDGKLDTLEGNFPQEIKPLAEEINALILANKSVTERARTQVGNLAHALKTPLAVIHNEARVPDKNLAKRVTEQANIMQSQITKYLARARIAAQRNVISTRTPVEPTIEKIVGVVRKLSPNINISLEAIDVGLTFKGEDQDLQEVVGNLLENSARFAKSKVIVSASNCDASQPASLCLIVEDDGPGISIEERKTALLRGERLDETQPGSGLGLSIVSDIAKEYGGRFDLEKSELGGLRAVVYLPKAIVG